MIFGQEQANLASRFLKEIPVELLEQGQGSRVKGQERSTESLPAPGPRTLPSHNLAVVASMAHEVEVVPEPER